MSGGRLRPTADGFWWLSLDDGSQVTCDPTLVRVALQDGELSARWCDGCGLSIWLRSPEQEIGMLSQAVSYASRGSSWRGEHRLTWLGEARPPEGSPGVGDLRTIGGRPR